jgi:hypothetical protein
MEETIARFLFGDLTEPAVTERERDRAVVVVPLHHNNDLLVTSATLNFD